MFGRGVDSAGIIADGSADVFDADASGFQSSERFLEPWFVAGEFLDLLLRGTEGRGGGSIPFVEQVEGLHGGVIDFFCVSENALLGFQYFVLPRLRFGVFDLAGLEGPEVDEAEAILFALLQVFDTLANIVPRGVGGGNRLKVTGGEAIEQAKSSRRIERLKRFILRMNDGEMGSKLAKNGNGGRLVVDEDPALAGGGNFATHDEGAIVRFVQAIALEDFLKGGFAIGALKNRGNDGALGAGANHVTGSFLAEQKGERVDEDGFAGAGFASEKIQAGGELDRGIIDYGVVFQPQFNQHGAS